MIKNEREYKNLRSDIAKFRATLDYLAKARHQGTVSAAKIKIQEDATKGIIETLEREVKEYENLKAGKYKTNLDSIDALPTHLIRARITLNWTQKDLAKRVGTSEQQIQRYEATDYESASLRTIKQIGGIMRQQLNTQQSK